MAGMENKRKREGSVRVKGFDQACDILSRTSVEDAIKLLHGRLPDEGATESGARFLLPFLHQLEHHDDFSYVAKIHQPRSFAAGHAISDPKLHYYVEPDIDKLAKLLKNGKYCVLVGRRQSGKSTASRALMERLKRENSSCPVYVSLRAQKHWNSRDMWRQLCIYLNLGCSSLFRRPGLDEERNEDVLFMSYFHRNNLTRRVTLIWDEADSLLNLNTECLDILFSTIKSMRDDAENYNLHGFLLIGVETVKDLLEAQFDRKALEARERGVPYSEDTTPSRLSPFPHDWQFTPEAFNLQDVLSLLYQANSDLCGAIHDAEEIAASILALTSGHKGLVCTCLAFMVQEELFTFRAWLRKRESYELGMYVFGQATYAKITRKFKAWASNPAHYDTMVRFLEQVDCRYGDVSHLRGMLAEGIIVAERDNGTYLVRLSSPLLRTAILRKAIVVGQQVSAPPSREVIDRMWVVLETISTLDADCIFRLDSLNATGTPSEYVHQFNFMCRLKAVLAGAYPSIHTVILPEAKEAYVRGYRRSRMRLDTLVRDADEFPKFGFEFVVEGDVVKHLEQAKTYRRQHSAQVFLVHFATDKDPKEIQPDDDGVFFVGVTFNTQEKTATVRTLDARGAREEHSVRMRNWTGRLSFCNI